MQGVAHALTASDGSASRLPMSRETMGQSGSNTRFNGENFSIAAALRSSPFGGSRLHLWILEDSCFSSEHYPRRAWPPGQKSTDPTAAARALPAWHAMGVGMDMLASLTMGLRGPFLSQSG